MLGDKGERRHMLGDKERCDHTFGVPSETPNLCFGLYSSFLIGSEACAGLGGDKKLLYQACYGPQTKPLAKIYCL